jgi:hypothetical protein
MLALAGKQSFGQVPRRSLSSVLSLTAISLPLGVTVGAARSGYVGYVGDGTVTTSATPTNVWFQLVDFQLRL